MIVKEQFSVAFVKDTEEFETPGDGSGDGGVDD